MLISFARLKSFLLVGSDLVSPFFTTLFIELNVAIMFVVYTKYGH